MALPVVLDAYVVVEAPSFIEGGSNALNIGLKFGITATPLMQDSLAVNADLTITVPVLSNPNVIKNAAKVAITTWALGPIPGVPNTFNVLRVIFPDFTTEVP